MSKHSIQVMDMKGGFIVSRDEGDRVLEGLGVDLGKLTMDGTHPTESQYAIYNIAEEQGS